MPNTAHERIIFALDVPTFEDAQELIHLLGGQVGLFKIGLELFIEAGPRIVAAVRETGGSGIFLDLKLHDIPATVGRAMGRIAQLGVRFATVHCGENRAMLEAAVQAGGARVGVIGVTVLTSVSAADIQAAGFSPELSADLQRLVLRRARMAQTAGCAGVVCSPREVAQIKRRFGSGFITITPGIRLPDAAVADDDQQRVATPAWAVAQGADYLVIGRPIRDASDPRETAAQIAHQIAAVPVNRDSLDGK